ncbi:MAG: NAD(P)H-binding protein [Anaeromyxobacteraceae bacterium]
MSRSIHAITGAFGYSGRAIAARLLARGLPVRNLTGHAGRPDPFDGRVETRPLPFEDPDALRRSLEGVEVLYNTWWVRFAHGDRSHERAVAASTALIEAARAAGVERVVHVSITRPSLDSPLPYFSGKARVEEVLRASGLSHAILRPAVFFGGRDVLLNNIAWLLRRLPIFGLVGGSYGLRPIHVEDFAALAVSEGERRLDVVRDAVGPDAFTFEELVRRIGSAVGSRARSLRVAPWMLQAASAILGVVVRDVPLTRDEIAGLTGGLLESPGPATGEILLGEWLDEHGPELGREWASELGRHFG